MHPCPNCGYTPILATALNQEVVGPQIGWMVGTIDQLPAFPTHGHVMCFIGCLCGQRGPKGRTPQEAEWLWDDFCVKEYHKRMFLKYDDMAKYRRPIVNGPVDFDTETGGFKKKTETKMIGTCQYKDCKCQRGEMNVLDILSQAC